MPYAFTGFLCNNNLGFVLSVQTRYCWLPTNNFWSLLVQWQRLGSERINESNYFVPLYDFDPGYSAINLVTYVYQNVQRTSKVYLKLFFAQNIGVFQLSM